MHKLDNTKMVVNFCFILVVPGVAQHRCGQCWAKRHRSQPWLRGPRRRWLGLRWCSPCARAHIRCRWPPKCSWDRFARPKENQNSIRTSFRLIPRFHFKIFFLVLLNLLNEVSYTNAGILAFSPVCTLPELSLDTFSPFPCPWWAGARSEAKRCPTRCASMRRYLSEVVSGFAQTSSDQAPIPSWPSEGFQSKTNHRDVRCWSE